MLGLLEEAVAAGETTYLCTSNLSTSRDAAKVVGKEVGKDRSLECASIGLLTALHYQSARDMLLQRH